MDWKSVAEKIVQDDQNKWDRTASAKELPERGGRQFRLKIRVAATRSTLGSISEELTGTAYPADSAGFYRLG